MSKPDNSPFLTIGHILGSYHVSLMEWDARADDYQVTVSKQYRKLVDAEKEVAAWSKRENLEVR